MNSSGKTFLVTGVLSALAPPLRAAGQPSGTPLSSRPNVIVILADDLGYGDLSCYGARLASTPNVDRLARQGTRFSDCHAVASTSTPSRYSLLTGEYAWRRRGTDVAQGDAAMIIPPEQYTLADLFHGQGYATAAVGKWHLGLGSRSGQQDWNGVLTPTPRDLGFDYHYIMAATADRVPCVFIEDGRVAQHDPSAPISVSYRENFDGEPTGRTHPERLFNLRPSHGHDGSIVNGISRIGFMKGGGRALWKDENIADSIAAHAVDFIRAHSREPFFLYLATNDVHVPRFPHARFRGHSAMGLRGDAIAQFDWTVGQVMAALDSLGITDNTLVIVTSDNGPVLDDGYEDRAEQLVADHRPAGPFRGYKYSAYEGGTAVPFIVRWPARQPAAHESPALLSQVDLLASMAALLGVRLPRGSAPDSRNHLAALLGQDRVGCPYVIEESCTHVLSVRTPRWKYIEASSGATRISWTPKIETGNRLVPQLFDLKSSLWEENNVAAQHPKVLKRLMRILRRACKRGRWM